MRTSRVVGLTRRTTTARELLRTRFIRFPRSARHQKFGPRSDNINYFDDGHAEVLGRKNITPPPSVLAGYDKFMASVLLLAITLR